VREQSHPGTRAGKWKRKKDVEMSIRIEFYVVQLICTISLQLGLTV